jgi:hypothetical protein
MHIHPVLEQLASIGPPAENYSKLNAIHSMRRDAGRGKPDAPKQLPPGLSHELLSAARHGALALLSQVKAQTSQQPGARAQLAAALSSDEFCCLEALLDSTGRTFNDVSVTDMGDDEVQIRPRFRIDDVKPAVLP